MRERLVDAGAGGRLGERASALRADSEAATMQAWQPVRERLKRYATSGP